MRAIEAFESTTKRARALMRAHKKLRGPGPGKRPRSHGELLRAAVVTAVSAMDAYFHDKILENIPLVIRRTKPKFPEELIKLIVEDAKAGKVAKGLLGISMKKRPLSHVRTMIEKKLNDRAFQDPGKIERGLKLIGVGHFWDRVGRELEVQPKQAKKDIMRYVNRRHKIVHRGDLGTAKKTKHQVRQITRGFAQECIDTVDKFVHYADTAINAEI